MLEDTLDTPLPVLSALLEKCALIWKKYAFFKKCTTMPFVVPAPLIISTHNAYVMQQFPGYGICYNVFSFFFQHRAWCPVDGLER